MSDIVITKIEGSAKIEAFIGVCITTLMGAFLLVVNQTGTVPFEIMWAICLFIVFFIGIQAMYYVKFMIEKWVFLKEQKQQSELQQTALTSRIRELELEVQLKQLDTGTNMT